MLRYKNYGPVVALLFLLLQSLTAFPQNINGIVHDAANGKALMGVTIGLFKDGSLQQQHVVTTDSIGAFTFKQVEKGNYLLRLSDIMYKQEQRNILVTDADVNLGVIALEASITTLQAITVASKKKFIERKIDKTVLNVENSPAAAGSSVLDVLQTAPGVSVTDEQISLKGRKGPTIMINGRPTNLGNADLAHVLESLPANAVSKIELIANPSAQNDAAGSAGIINIVTKKMTIEGFNSTINAGAGFGVYPKYNGGINLNYRVNLLNLYGNYYLSDNQNFSRYTSKKVVDDILFDESGRSAAHNTAQNYVAGLDYQLDPRNTIGFSVTGNTNNSKFKEDFNTAFILIKPDSSLLVNNLTTGNYHNTAWNLNHELRIDSTGRLLTTNVDYARFLSHTDGGFNNTYLDNNGQLLRDEEMLRNLGVVDIKIGTVKIDYTHPLPLINTTIQAGIKSGIVKTDSDIRFDRKDGSTWTLDSDKTNHFLFDEYINAAYLNLNRKFNKYELQAGLRAEQTNNKGTLLNGNSVHKNNYLQFFPSLFVSRRLGNTQSIDLSYGRRINRPSYEDLNPFIYYNSPYSYYQGNTYLKPEFTNTVSLGYSLKDELMVSLSYSNTSDYFTYLSYLNDTTQVTKESIANFNHYVNYGLSVSLDKNLTDWWYLSANADLLHESFSSFYVDENFKTSIVSLSTNLTSEFTLSKNSAFVLTGLYRSPTIDGIKKNLARYRVDVGYRKNFLDKRLILKVAVRDLFYMYRKDGINRIANLNQEFTNRSDTRVLSVDLTYKFGNQKLQSRKQKKGNTDELNRIKGMN